MKLHGKNGQIYLNGTPLSYGTEWSVQIDRDYADVTVFGDLGKTFTSGLRGTSGTFQGLLNVGSDEAVAASKINIPITIAIYAQPGSLVASGQGYVDVVMTGAVSDAVRLSGTIRGIGAWTI